MYLLNRDTGNRGCIDSSVSLSSSFLEERNARLEKCRYSEIRYEVRQALVKWWKGGGREAVSERERGGGSEGGEREGKCHILGDDAMLQCLQGHVAVLVLAAPVSG